MNKFVPELLREMQAAIRKGSHLAKERTPISILPVRESSPSERLPWEPGRIELTPDEVQLLARLRWELSQELGSEGVISESDVLYFALEQLQLKLRGTNSEDVLLRVGYHLWNVRQ